MLCFTFPALASTPVKLGLLSSLCTTRLHFVFEMKYCDLSFFPFPRPHNLHHLFRRKCPRVRVVNAHNQIPSENMSLKRASFLHRMYRWTILRRMDDNSNLPWWRVAIPTDNRRLLSASFEPLIDR